MQYKRKIGLVNVVRNYRRSKEQYELVKEPLCNAGVFHTLLFYINMSQCDFILKYMMTENRCRCTNKNGNSKKVYSSYDHALSVAKKFNQRTFRCPVMTQYHNTSFRGLYRSTYERTIAA